MVCRLKQQTYKDHINEFMSLWIPAPQAANPVGAPIVRRMGGLGPRGAQVCTHGSPSALPSRGPTARQQSLPRQAMTTNRTDIVFSIVEHRIQNIPL